MKKLSLILAFLLAFSVFFACSTEPANGRAAETPSPDPAETELSVLELAYPGGNYYLAENERVPFTAKLPVKTGWTAKTGELPGTAYYPNAGTAALCLAANTGGGPLYCIYDENGECAATAGCVSLVWTDEMEDPASLGRDELIKASIRYAYAEQSMGSMHRIALDITPESEIYENGSTFVLVTYARYDAKGADTPVSVAFPVIVSFNTDLNVGVFIEFADGALTGEELSAAARGFVIAEATK